MCAVCDVCCVLCTVFLRTQDGFDKLDDKLDDNLDYNLDDKLDGNDKFEDKRVVAEEEIAKKKFQGGEGEEGETPSSLLDDLLADDADQQAKAIRNERARGDTGGKKTE